MLGFFGPRKKRVLVADDDENVRSMVEMALSTLDLDVDAVPNGTEAVRKLTTVKYDLAILDHNMPGMTGVQILEVVTTSPYAKETKFIMLTAESQVGIIDRAYSYKAQDYIMKPFDVAKLLVKVQAILQK